MRQDLVVLRALSFLLFILLVLIGHGWAKSQDKFQNLSEANKTVTINSQDNLSDYKQHIDKLDLNTE